MVATVPNEDYKLAYNNTKTFVSSTRMTADGIYTSNRRLAEDVIFILHKILSSKSSMPMLNYQINFH